MEKEIAEHARVNGLVRSWMARVLCLLIIGSIFPNLCRPEEPVRKLLSGPPPAYPDLARKLNIKGIARVRITIAKDGKVREVKELGGNPVLLSALVDAVKKWKYETAPGETVTEVRFEFQ
jgi:TonB family protein